MHLSFIVCMCARVMFDQDSCDLLYTISFKLRSETFEKNPIWLQADKPKIISSFCIMFSTHCAHRTLRFSAFDVVICEIIEQTYFRLLVFSMQIEETFSIDGLYLCEKKQHTLSLRYWKSLLRSYAHRIWNTFYFLLCSALISSIFCLR